MTLRIPALRFGGEYYSEAQHNVVDLGTQEVLAQLSQVIPAQIATDCQRSGLMDRAFTTLRKIPIQDRIAMSKLAGQYFICDTLPIGEEAQDFAGYREMVCRISGLSYPLLNQTAMRISATLDSTESIINGLSGGIPLEIFDTGFGNHAGAPVRLVPQLKTLGCCMPGNSPGVNVIPAIAPAFGVPYLIRPGSAEPVTAYRMTQAFIKAGFPAECFGYYPCGHAGANIIPDLTKGAIVFGSDETVGKWKHNPLIHRHGSGFSKLILGEDIVDEWEQYLDIIVNCIAGNSGRSCYAVSLIVTPRYRDEIAEEVARRLAKIKPLPLDDAKSMLSAMAMPSMAKKIDKSINDELATGGAEDVTARFREGERLTMLEGRTYMQPTLVACDDMDHPLARKEFLFPYAGIVEASNDKAFTRMGPTLSLGLVTRDPELETRAIMSEARLLNINTSTGVLQRSQPHEEHFLWLLYKRLSCVKRPL